MLYRLSIIATLSSLVFATLARGENIVVGEGGSGITVLEQQQNRTAINIRISEIELEQAGIEGQNGSEIFLPDAFGKSVGAFLGSGNILIPTITRKIAIPFDSEPVLRVTRSSFRELDDITLATAGVEEMESYDSENPDFILRQEDQIAYGEVAGIMRDLRIYSVTVAPVKYDKENARLYVYDDIDIEVEHSGSIMTRYQGQISEAFAPIYKSILDNPAVIDPIEITRGAYWIIYPDGFESQIRPLAEWKGRKGFDIEMIAKSDIGSNPSYLNIKNYISDRFDSCLVKPDYITILGDVTMPSNLGMPTRNYPNPYGMGDIESDNYYTFIDGNDYFPECFIGRISVDYVNELSSYLTKFFTYERTPYMDETDWYLRGTVVAGGDNGYFVSPRITKLWCAEQMTESGFTNVDTLFDSYTHYVTAADINNSINSGVCFVNYRGYGYPSGWTAPYYTSSNLNSLYNGPKYAIMTSIVCGTGDYNDYTDVCFGESWIRYNGKGGPGFIGNTNHDAHTVWTNAIDCGIYWGLFTKKVSTISQAQFMGKMTLWDAFPNDRYMGGQVDLYFNSYNILGDPELNCWTGIPKQMDVSYPDSIDFGQNLLTVQVDDNLGGALEGAYVCVTNDNDVFVGGFTSQDGSINLDIMPNAAGGLYVTATAHGFIPHEGQVACHSSDVAVGYSSHVIDDDNTGESSGNGNGIANPSETIELRTDLYNFGQSVTATGVTAILSSESPFITVVRDSAGFGDIAPGVLASANPPYLISISQEGLNNSSADLFLTISDNNGNNWSSVVRVSLEAAEFEVSGVTILDSGNGQIDPGEIFEMYLTVSNTGNSDMTGATAILRTGDDQVTISDSIAVFGNCPQGGSFDNSGDTFMLSVDAAIYVGHLLNFTLDFTGDGPQEVTAAFNQTVGTVDDSDPIGPDNYGYYCFDNTDIGYPIHPPYEWFAADGWPFVQPADDDVITISLPFPVSYYGQVYDEVTLCDNGFIALGESWWNAWQNTPMPAPQTASAMIAAFWDDLKYSSYSSMGPRIYYHHDEANGRFIILYDNAWADDVYRYQTFEFVFLNQYDWPTETGDNDIIIQYLDVNNPYSATVGICSPDRADGIEYLFDNSYVDGAAPLVDGRAIKFTTGSLYYTDVKDGGTVPEGFSLSQNYPNPFNAVSAIEFSMPEAENVKIEVFNLLGQKVETLIDSRLDAGTHTVYWNAGEQSSGVYFYKLTAGEYEDIKRMTLLK